MTDHVERLNHELLVLAAQRGDPDAFRSLMQTWQARLWRHAASIVGDRDAASDVVQEAWLVIAGGICGLRDPARLPAWLHTIVARRAADWLRRRRVRTGSEDPTVMVGDIAEVAIDDAAADAKARMHAALLRLPADRRRLLTLHHVDGLSIAELAEVVGVPEGTVKSRLYHAREELRAAFERRGSWASS